MKLFYHFLVLVGASLIMVACASMFASTPEKNTGKSTQSSGNNLNHDALLPPAANTQLIFSDLRHYDFFNGYDYGMPNAGGKKSKSLKNLRIAADYPSLGYKEK